MIWSDFGPYVMPHVIGCPEPVMEHHAKLAAMAWCRKTLCWQKWLDPVKTISGSYVVELDLEPGQQIVKIKQAHIAGRDLPLLHPDAGRALVMESAQNVTGTFLESTNTLYVLPKPEGVESITVHACLTTSMASTSFSDELAEYVSDIAWGVIASIQLLPNQVFSNPNAAQINAGMFKSRVDTIAAKIGRGSNAVYLAGGVKTRF